LPALLFLLAVRIASLFSPALFADDFPSAPMASGDQYPAVPGSSVRWANDSSSQAALVGQESPSKPNLGSSSVTVEATEKRHFSHTKWEGPAAVVPSESILRWKGAFQVGRRSPAATDPGVVRTGGEMPLEAVQPLLPPDLPKRSSSDVSNSPAAAPPRGTEPRLPVRIATTPKPNAAPTTLEQQLAGNQGLSEKCLSPRSLKSISSITADIGVKPEDLTGSKRLPPECSLDNEPFRPRRWQPVTFAWTAASTCHNPLYFEDEQLERYGHAWGPARQAAVSAVQFFATVPLTPYYMGVYPPNECIYDLGQYRPGSCAPYYLDPLPLSVRGALYEGAFLGLLPAL